jgi:SAM-dependent methyltransferase
MHLLIEINRVLKPGGALVLTTPNVVSWASVLRMARLEHPMAYPWFFPGKVTNRHNLEYTPQMLRSLLRSAGFEGEVSTADVWSEPDARAIERLVAAGFTDFDRGDDILCAMRKASQPLVRYDPATYLVEFHHKVDNQRVHLDYRKR